MKEFNKFQPFLETCEKVGHFYILGLEGDVNSWGKNETYFRGEPVPFKSYKDRKNEGDRWVASILTFDERSITYSHKSLYRNTKGVYFKGLKYEKSQYILMAPLPENMK